MRKKLENIFFEKKDNNAVTLQSNMLMIDLGKDIHEGFSYIISGLNTSNFVSLHMILNYTNGEIV